MRPLTASKVLGSDPVRVLRDVGEAEEVARLLAPKFAQRADELDRTGSFPVEDFAELRSSGLLGLMVPKRLGGPGATFGDYATIAMILAGGSGATALAYNMHVSVTGAIAQAPDDLARAVGAPEHWFDARDEILLHALGGAHFAVAMSERTAGSRLSEIATTYELRDDRFQISGSKCFVSGAGHADAYLVAARAADEPARVSYFLVPDGPGMSVEETWDSLGMRATASHDLHLDIAVERDALLGGVEGLVVLLAQVMPQWLVASYAAVYVGIARAALDAATEYVNRRSLAALPAVRARLGRADAAVAAAELVVGEAARRVDTAPDELSTRVWVYRAKLIAGETASEVASSMLEAAGTGALRRGSGLERLYRDARCGSLQPATSDVCADWLGCAALGLDPELDSVVPRW